VENDGWKMADGKSRPEKAGGGSYAMLLEKTTQ
jgi:hypothetical protein